MSSGDCTEGLSVAVGPGGRVYAQNDEFTRGVRDAELIEALAERLEGGRLQNVQRLDCELYALGLEAKSVDFVLTALNFNDVHNSLGEDAVRGFLVEAHRVLKPDGVFGMIDHAGRVRADNKALHRIPESTVVRAVEAAGFVVEERSRLLRNRADNRTASAFAKSISGKTDRFILRVRKAG